MKKIIFRNFQNPGDVLVLTAAIRDLHLCYPQRYITDIRSPFPELWENNPYITPIDDKESEVEFIDCEYNAIERSNRTPIHFLQGFIEDFNNKLNLEIKISSYMPDIYLSLNERALPCSVERDKRKLWIIVVGGNSSTTVKWWDPTRYQEVVDHFENRIQFVQVGLVEDYHPRLKNVLNIVGKTTIRELILLMHYADGVLCPITFAMHLAAAVECRDKRWPRACVVLAGGREPPHWEAYPHHQFLHTIGALSCCAFGGCWKWRTKPLGDGKCYDHYSYRCLFPDGEFPRCMNLIQPRDVIQKIEMYLQRYNA